MARPTLRTVADAAGVSTATVSYVLSGRAHRVSEETAQRVREVAASLRYRSDRMARAMRTGRTELIHLSLQMLADPWSQSISEAVSAAGRQAGLATLILADGDWFEVLSRQRVDVAFIDYCDTTEGAWRLRRLVDDGQRLVVFHPTLEPDGFSVIRSRDEPACRAAVEQLLDRFGRVACLAPVDATAPEGVGGSRYRQYAAALAARGLPLLPGDIGGYTDPISAFQAALRLLDSPDPPPAIFCATDFAAIAAIQAARTRGMAVPGDVCVLGAGNTAEGERWSPTLSTVGPRDLFSRLAEIVVEVALDQAPPEPRLYPFAWELIERGSTAMADGTGTGTGTGRGSVDTRGR